MLIKNINRSFKAKDFVAILIINGIGCSTAVSVPPTSLKSVRLWVQIPPSAGLFFSLCHLSKVILDWSLNEQHDRFLKKFVQSSTAWSETSKIRPVRVLNFHF